MRHRALLFGSIGTLVETSDWQRQAFNEAFRESGLNWSWTPEVYRSLLQRSGGQNLIARFAAARGEWVDASMIDLRRTALFHQMITDRGLLPRAGVVDVIRQAKLSDIALGLATTASLRDIDAIFDGLGGTILRDDFAYVGHHGLVANAKPWPDIYLDAMRALGVVSQQVIAIEDAAISFESAMAAGVRCIAFPDTYASEQSFDDAVTVTRNLTWQVIDAAYRANAVVS